ncbi:MAG: hypothetical protein AAF650_06890 [Pseudomonadota bacterium]
MVSDIEPKEPKEPTDYRALGITFMTLGVSMGVVFGVTLGWMFAPVGLAFFALGLTYLSKVEKD